MLSIPITNIDIFENFRELVDKKIRWIKYPENISAVIRYIPGKENVLSDFISRTIKKEEVLNVVNFIIYSWTFVVMTKIIYV